MSSILTPRAPRPASSAAYDAATYGPASIERERVALEEPAVDLADREGRRQRDPGDVLRHGAPPHAAGSVPPPEERYASSSSSTREATSLGRPVEHDPAALHHEHMVGDLQRLLHVLLDEQNADAVLVRRPANRLEQPDHDERREPERELVDQKHLRRPGKCAGKRQHLLLAAREEPGPALEERTELGEEVEGALDVDPPHAEVLDHREPHEDRALLGDEREAVGRPAMQGRLRQLAVEPDLARELRADRPRG